jgi:23S rRNA pseudouridine1911/1915/1917 synthase
MIGVLTSPDHPMVGSPFLHSKRVNAFFFPGEPALLRYHPHRRRHVPDSQLSTRNTELPQMRLDLVVSRVLSLSRRAARDAVRAGRIEVDGVTADEPGRDIPESAKIAFHPSRPARYRVRTRLSVLAEDDDYLIVDKPAGLLSVPTAEHEKDTLLARTLDYLHHRFGRRPAAFVVHRLDKDTSGGIVFARNRPTLRFLQDLFKSHAIEREYLALVEGTVPDSGTLSADLVADAGSARRGVARPGEQGKRAVTRYRAIERPAGATLVSVELETGRTHQIRVHFAAAGHPVLGDRVYGGSRESRVESRESKLPEPPRQMLHARRLGFPHPRTGKSVRAEAPLPEDFVAVLEDLRRRSRIQGRDSGVRAKKKAPRGAPGRSRNSRL